MSDSAMEKIANQELIDGLLAPKGSEMYKEASEASDEYLRMRLYEDGFFRKILPMRTLTSDELTEQVDTDIPTKVVEKEPNAAAAYTVPFGTMPIGAYIKGPKFRIMFHRIMSRRHRIDIDKLGTYRMDIKKVMENILLKKIQEEEDRKFLSVVTFIVTQSSPAAGGHITTDPALIRNANGLNANSVNSELAAAQNIELGPMDRDSLAELTKALPTTNRSLNPSIALVNNVTVRDVVKLSRDEIGGDLAEEMFKNGFSEQKIMGLDWAVTIKKNLVLTNTIFQFTEPEFMGKNFALRDTTLSTKSEDIWIEFWAWETLGGAIGNSASVAAAHFTGTALRHWEDGTVYA